MRCLLVFAAVLSSSVSALADEYAALPPGEGRDVMVRVCSQCHTPEMAAGQSMDAQGWKDLVSQMMANGAEASDAEFATIEKYLAASFPPK